MSEVESRIKFSSEDMKCGVGEIVERLVSLRYSDDFSKLGEPFLSKLNYWTGSIRKREDDSVSMVVIGNFKRGKSSFVNALLGEKVVPVNVTTETVTMNRISYGQRKNEAVLSKNRRIELSDAELSRAVIEKIQKTSGESIRWIDLRRDIDVLRNLTIIDTPGTDDASFNCAGLIKESLMQADMVVYLYSVAFPLSLSEQYFLRSSVIPQKYTKFLLVGNHGDEVESPAEFARLKRNLTEKIHMLLPDSSVIVISALDEACRRAGTNRPNLQLAAILGLEFDTLRAQIAGCIEDKKDVMIVDRLQRMSAMMFQDLDGEIELVERAVSDELNQAKGFADKFNASFADKEKQLAQLHETLAQKIETMKLEAKNWMFEIIDRINQEVENLNSFPLDDILKYFSFFCMDKLQDGFDACLEYHRQSLINFLDVELSDSPYYPLQALRVSKDNVRYGFRFNLDNKTWTNGDQVGIAVSFGAGLFREKFETFATVITSITDFITGSLRKHEAEGKKPEFISQIKQQMLELVPSIDSSIDKTYDELHAKAKKTVDQYYEDLVDEMQRCSAQGLELAGKTNEEKAQILKSVASVRKTLDKLSNTLR